MNPVARHVGRWLAGWLTRPRVAYTSVSPPTDSRLLAETLQAGDVLLVEGNTRISAAIKYLTQSTWSHAALYVGPQDSAEDPLRALVFIEADTIDGVRCVSLAKYDGLHTRICRPVGLTEEDRGRVVAYALERIGLQYDLKNIFDLARYLFPTPPVPQRWRRRMLTLGSGDPTRAICSTLIAQCFQSVRYPILPQVKIVPAARPGCETCVDEVLTPRHHSLFVPRDFDTSPYFAIVKPTLGEAFDYRRLHWSNDEAEKDLQPSPTAAAGR
ncbi:MAG TPA: YiiX/YebB-like N1pC/P60 family cysteine hydrolase [Rhodocyclaceae bacterium]